MTDSRAKATSSPHAIRRRKQCFRWKTTQPRLLQGSVRNNKFEIPLSRHGGGAIRLRVRGGAPAAVHRCAAALPRGARARRLPPAAAPLVVLPDHRAAPAQRVRQHLDARARSRVDGRQTGQVLVHGEACFTLNERQLCPCVSQLARRRTDAWRMRCRILCRLT